MPVIEIEAMLFVAIRDNTNDIAARINFA